MLFASEAALERRWARALHWTHRAKSLVGPNARILADEGEFLFQLGLFEEAVKAFSEASHLDTEEGYVDYRGAQAAAAAGKAMNEVFAWVARALEKSPDLVGDLELFREFEGLQDQPGYGPMIARAYTRLGINPPNAASLDTGGHKE